MIEKFLIRLRSIKRSTEQTAIVPNHVKASIFRRRAAVK
jgi:hypothetical protein